MGGGVTTQKSWSFIPRIVLLWFPGVTYHWIANPAYHTATTGELGLHLKLEQHHLPLKPNMASAQTWRRTTISEMEVQEYRPAKHN